MQLFWFTHSGQRWAGVHGEGRGEVWLKTLPMNWRTPIPPKVVPGNIIITSGVEQLPCCVAQLGGISCLQLHIDGFSLPSRGFCKYTADPWRKTCKYLHVTTLHCTLSLPHWTPPNTFPGFWFYSLPYRPSDEIASVSKYISVKSRVYCIALRITRFSFPLDFVCRLGSILLVGWLVGISVWPSSAAGLIKITAVIP